MSTSSTTGTATTTTTTAPTTTGPTTTAPTTPTERLLTAALLVAPLLSLAADSTYAARGWDDGTAGAVHVLGAVAYGFVVLRVATWLPPDSRLAAVVLLTGLIGTAGNVAYGFDAVHASYGDTPLVDRDGVAALIKPLGLFFPAFLVVVALVLLRLGRRRPGVLVLVAAVAWPVAHIANVAALAVAVNVVLVLAFGGLARPRPAAR